MADPLTGPHCRIGIDVGGTFTDFVLSNRRTGELVNYKEPSVPTDPSLSVSRGIPSLLARAKVETKDIELIVHGTTLLVNAIIQHRGPKVALVVSKGHRGVLEIGRARLTNSYNYKVKKEPPLVPRDLVFETSARVLADGTVLAKADPAELDAIAAKLKAEKVEAVAVMLLHSYAHPELERMVATELRKRLPGVAITESWYVWPEKREFERSQVAIMNAFSQPIMQSYLNLLIERVRGIGVKAPIYITANNGGTLSIETARNRPIDTVLSGPASGVVAATRTANEAGYHRIITVDIGGTSCDVALATGSDPEYSTRTHVGDYPLILPVVDVSSIGAGGGSIISVDAQGVLKVGPESSGADPGPVCYGRGGKRPTLTDCYLTVGFIHPDHFLGGRLKLDQAAARRALEDIADKIGLTGDDRGVKAAESAIRVATAIMTTEMYKEMAGRGQDPRDFALMAFGGAGPTHGNLLADEAMLSTMIVPPSPGTFCAMGAILSDVKRDYVRSHHIRFADGAAAEAAVAKLFGELEGEAREWVKDEGDLLGATEYAGSLDMRYHGEAFDLRVVIPDALRRKPERAAISELFHREHEKVYGFRDNESDVEATTERLRVTGKIPPIELPKSKAGGGAKPRENRRVFHQGQYLDVPVYFRPLLGRNDRLVGPAIVEQEDSTTWVMPGWTVEIDPISNLIVRKG